MRAFAVAAVILTAVSLSGCGGGGTTTQAPGEMTIVDTAIATPDLSTLVTALTTADLVATLQGPGPFTVFAPTNEAFAAIQSVVDGLDVPQLTDVLLAHVVSGTVLSSDLTDGQVVQTLFPGASVTVGISDAGVVTITSDSGAVGTVGPANVLCSNGVVHIVSAVLVPTGLPADVTTTPTPAPPAGEMTIADTAIANPDLSTLVSALTTADLVTTLQGPGPFTVFAPTNEAFAAIQATVDGLDVGQLTDVLLAHVVSGTFLSTDLTDGQVVPTLFPGASVTVGISAAGVVTITSDSGAVGTVGPANVLCTNGVVHVVSAVLVPTGLPAAATTTTTAGEMTIVDTAIATPDLSTLVSALTTADLVTTLQGAGPFTVFAPTNEAFAAIQATVDGLNTEQLTDVLLAHVVSGAVLSSDLTDGQVVPTLFPGASVTVGISAAGVVTITSDSGAVGTVGPANVLCTNGVVHVVSAVLVPTGLPADVTTTAGATISV